MLLGDEVYLEGDESLGHDLEQFISFPGFLLLILLPGCHELKATHHHALPPRWSQSAMD